MPKVGNYIQRDYHKRFGSNRKSTWSDYNKAWSKRRQSSAQKTQQLSNLANTFGTINVQASQANTLYIMQNQSRLNGYSSPTAVMSRVNVLV
ncbi:flagellar biosynthesis protein [Roseibium sp.]|uniref:flagellar biosynthesis protein n=1 Tax=Roseibium sp. TaxID=1936156 RepID=UPI003D0F1CC8